MYVLKFRPPDLVTNHVGTITYWVCSGSDYATFELMCAEYIFSV